MLHLMTDRRRRNEQLRRGLLEAETSRGRLEGPKGIERNGVAGLHGRFELEGTGAHPIKLYFLTQAKNISFVASAGVGNDGRIKNDGRLS